MAIETPVLLASLTGYVLGALVNSALNHRLTFASPRPHRKAAPRFFAVASLGLGLNLAIVTLLHARAAWYALAAQLCATLLCLLATYALNARWSFDETAGKAET